MIRFRALAVLLLLVGCSRGPVVLSPDGDYFEGLDPAVVEEVLASPVAVSQIEWSEGKDRERAAQAVVLRYGHCRELLRVYEDWLVTGVQPEFHPPELPMYPRPLFEGSGESMSEAWAKAFAYNREMLASGDIELLRFELVNPNGDCGDSVPAKPGDINGPTIADVVKGMG